jgi:thymidylate synthase ThyX
MISAKIIADSIDKNDIRITTFIVVMPRIVLAELNTHRAFSRNSASSRAIPFKKMVEMVKTNPFIPVRWQKDHTGMQGTEYFEENSAELCKKLWLEARDKAVAAAETFNEIEIKFDPILGTETTVAKPVGLTKQLVNRLMEPFMWHTVIITATDFENFFSLRAEGSAEIHIQELAYQMMKVYNESVPKMLKKGEWHIPFGDNMDEDKLQDLIHADMTESDSNWGNYNTDDLKIKIATARCAGVSYTVVGTDGKPEDYEKLIKRHDMLAKMKHMSPFEHCALCTEITDSYGNFKGWFQYRKMIPDENRTDNRVKKWKYL